MPIFPNHFHHLDLVSPEMQKSQHILHSLHFKTYSVFKGLFCVLVHLWLILVPQNIFKLMISWLCILLKGVVCLSLLRYLLFFYCSAFPHLEGSLIGNAIIL